MTEIRHLLYVYLYILETGESIQNLKLVFLSSLYSLSFEAGGLSFKGCERHSPKWQASSDQIAFPTVALRYTSSLS